MKQNRSACALILTSIVSVLPSFAFAAGDLQAQQLKSSFQNVGGVVNSFTTTIVSALATLFATTAMVVFFYGIVQYLWGIRDGKPDKVASGNKFMIWGIVGLFVMFSVWGIIIFFQNVFGIQGNNTIVVPKVQIGDGTGGSPSNSTTDSSQFTGYGTPGNYLCKSTGVFYKWSADYAKSCPDATSAGSQTTTTQQTCAGQPVGTSCTLSGGGQGYCQMNSQGGTMGCYAGNPCPAGQLPGPNGCSIPPVP